MFTSSACKIITDMVTTIYSLLASLGETIAIIRLVLLMTVIIIVVFVIGYHVIYTKNNIKITGKVTKVYPMEVNKVVGKLEVSYVINDEITKFQDIIPITSHILGDDIYLDYDETTKFVKERLALPAIDIATIGLIVLASILIACVNVCLTYKISLYAALYGGFAIYGFMSL